jgi:hypothetical protein
VAELTVVDWIGWLLIFEPSGKVISKKLLFQGWLQTQYYSVLLF